MSATETVRDRVADLVQDMLDTRPLRSRDGQPVSLSHGMADALLAAFPEIGLFERLEAWLVEDHARSVELIGATRPDGFVVGVGPTFNEHVEPTVAAALSAALDQAETQERTDGIA